MIEKILFLFFLATSIEGARDCKDHYDAGETENGVYTVNPDGQKEFQVYCDMKTDGGGWTVIQRRKDGSENFNRVLHEYFVGFGDLLTFEGEFWLGNENIDALNMFSTPAYGNVWYFSLVRFNGEKYYKKYRIWTKAQPKYEIFQAWTIFVLEGNASDSFIPYTYAPYFTTNDNDQDDDDNYNCGARYQSGWFFYKCTTAGPDFTSNLNGYYWPYEYVDYGIYWEGLDYSLKESTIMIRRPN